jgi:hypothetical protein
MEKLNSNQLDHLSLMEDLLTVLGEENMSILYHHLERLGVKRNEIANKPEEFSKALRVIFGQAASILEAQIVSSIASRTGHSYGPNVTLVEALTRLKAEESRSGKA